MFWMCVRAILLKGLPKTALEEPPSTVLCDDSISGPVATRDIRRSLPFIAIWESFIGSQRAKEIFDLVLAARRQLRSHHHRLAVEVDMTTLPVSFSVQPLSKYSHLLQNVSYDMEPVDRAPVGPGEPAMFVLKVREGNDSTLLFDPNFTLTLAFGWPGPRECSCSGKHICIELGEKPVHSKSTVTVVPPVFPLGAAGLLERQAGGLQLHNRDPAYIVIYQYPNRGDIAFQ
ncbi:hypothetical protein BS17DRAFT_881322 [Gyrodon lividus]|nr:hypothetical protein BS17DRAFT_881322 [Gyrodon lividus]